MKAIPTAHDRSFVPYAPGTDPDFDKCLPDIELQEGVAWSSGPMPGRAWSNDAHDPGGMTGEGITQKEYFVILQQWGLPLTPVRNMTKDQERTIYYTRYWLPYCPKLPDGMNLEFFNMSVNGGGTRAIKELQIVLHISADGVWGPGTEEAVITLQAAGNPSQAIIDYKNACDRFYEAIPGFRWFGKDWLRRDSEIEQEAEAIDGPGQPA
jgi:lysozyme family protein